LEDEDSCAECGDFEGDGEACECEDTCGRFLRRCAIADVAKAEGDKAGYERGVREEREACAKKAGEYADAWANHDHDKDAGWCAGVIAKAIRARGEPQAGDGKGGA